MCRDAVLFILLVFYFLGISLTQLPPVIPSQCRNTGVGIRPPEALSIIEMPTDRRENGLPHQRDARVTCDAIFACRDIGHWFAMTDRELVFDDSSRYVFSIFAV